MITGSSSYTSDFFAANPDALRSMRRWLLWSGIGLVVVGVVALMFPFMATIVSALFIGWLFVAAGIAALVRAFSHGLSGGSRFAAFALGVLRLIAGGYVIMNPLGGAVAITIVVAVLFIVDGVVGVFAAFTLRPMPGWGWALTASLMSVIAGMLVASGLPGASLVVLGTIVGITFLIDGIACLGRYGALGKSTPAV